jgi:hypothetical protein
MRDNFGLEFHAIGADREVLALSPGQTEAVNIQFPLVFDIDTALYLYFDPSPPVLDTHCGGLLPTGQTVSCPSE